jgi:hypothetical protein
MQIGFRQVPEGQSPQENSGTNLGSLRKLKKELLLSAILDVERDLGRRWVEILRPHGHRSGCVEYAQKPSWPRVNAAHAKTQSLIACALPLF